MKLAATPTDSFTALADDSEPLPKEGRPHAGGGAFAVRQPSSVCNPTVIGPRAGQSQAQ
jgi:hypothetical protein